MLALGAPATWAQGLDDPAAAKAVSRCHKAITSSAGSVATFHLKTIKKCLELLFDCVQLKASDPACLARVKLGCEARFAKLATAEAKARAAADKRCSEALLPFATLRQPAALDVDGIAESCGFYAVDSVESFGDYATCLLRQHDCQTADLLMFESPRAQELLALVGKYYPSQYCPKAPVLPTPIPTPVFNKVFVTSTTHFSDAIGGVTGADAICAARAATAGLPGTFVAWFSDSSANAAARLGSARGFIRLDGAPFADEFSDLAGFGQIFNPLNVNETNKLATGTVTVWTGTTRTGVVDQSTCLNWTSRDAGQGGGTGRVQGGPISWTARSTSGCDSARRLFCFQTDHTTPLVVTPAVGKRAFLSVGNFTPGAGIDAADQICTAEALAAGMPGTYKALLATTTTAAVARFPLAPLYVRPDGIAVGTGAQLAGGEGLMSGIWQNAFGTYGNNNPAWTGAATPSAVGTAGSTCNDWTSTASNSGIGGATTLADATWWSSFTNGSCTQAFKVYCLQE